MLIPLRSKHPHPPGFKPKVTYALIIVNIVIFFIEVVYVGQFLDFTNSNASVMFYNWGAVPVCVTGEFSGIDTGNGMIQCPAFSEITLLTSTFMHGGLIHLGGSLLFLWIFGPGIEQKFGKIKYLGIYLMWGVAAGLIHIFGDTGSAVPVVGASGAISGVLGAYVMIFPKDRIKTLFFIFLYPRLQDIRAKWFILVWFIVNIFAYLTSGLSGYTTSSSGYFGLLGGFLLGLSIGYVYKRIKIAPPNSL